MIKPDRQYWNILKGIGIFCVVLGHASGFFHDFVYAFHLPLFFFISGFMYSEEKYGDRPYFNLINRLKSSWINYVWIYWIILILHNTLIRWGLMPDGTAYFNIFDLVKALVLAMLGTANELMGGTLWFVPVLVLSNAFLGFIVYFSRKISKKFESVSLKFVVQVCLVIVCIPIGWKVAGVLMPCNLQVVFLVVFFQWIGYLLRNYGKDIQRYLDPCVALIFMIVVWMISKKHPLDLIFGNVYIGMYTVAFMGIYLCMVLAVYVQRLRIISRIIAYMGQCSFWIMVLHFPIIKIIDKIWALHIGDVDRQLYLTLPHSFSNMWPIYILLGIGVPVCSYTIYIKIKGKIHAQTNR